MQLLCNDGVSDGGGTGAVWRKLEITKSPFFLLRGDVSGVNFPCDRLEDECPLLLLRLLPFEFCLPLGLDRRDE